MSERLHIERMVAVPRSSRRFWMFAAVLGLGLAAGSGIVPAAAQSGGTTISIRPLDPVEVAFPDIGPTATTAGSTSDDESGPRVTSSSGIHVVIDGNLFGGN